MAQALLQIYRRVRLCADRAEHLPLGQIGREFINRGVGVGATECHLDDVDTTDDVLAQPIWRLGVFDGVDDVDEPVRQDAAKVATWDINLHFLSKYLKQV